MFERDETKVEMFEDSHLLQSDVDLITDRSNEAAPVPENQTRAPRYTAYEPSPMK